MKHRVKQKSKLFQKFKRNIRRERRSTILQSIRIFSMKKWPIRCFLLFLSMYSIRIRLNLQVIPKKHSVPSPIPVVSSSNREPLIHYVETATNNIVYPRLIFNLNHISSVRDMLNLPVLLYLINNIDTETFSIEEMETLTSECSGGIRMNISCYPQYHGDNTTYRNVALEDRFEIVVCKREHDASYAKPQSREGFHASPSETTESSAFPLSRSHCDFAAVSFSKYAHGAHRPHACLQFASKRSSFFSAEFLR